MRNAAITGKAGRTGRPFARTYKTPAKPNAVQPIPKAARKVPGELFIALILASANLLIAQEPPANLAKLAAHRETETEAERNQYMYRQSVTIEELEEGGRMRGDYHELRDVIFSPTGERTEQTIGKPRNALKNLILTDEDFRDIRDIQPLVLTDERLWNYETKFKGEENVDNVDCWVLQVRPRQILDGQRLFDGMVWIEKQGYNIVRMTGRAVPQIRTLKTENLFPSFTTIRKPIDGKHWFPVYTYADDTLQFRGGPQRERLKIEFSGYKRFGAESTFIVK
jgi:hypothetical protein